MKHIHDRRYKYVFSHPIFVQRLLESFVHEDFISQLDFNSMAMINTEFITKKLKKYESDIVYRIEYNNKPIYIFLLMEFQSNPSKDMPIRFLRYILELYENHRKEHKGGLYPAVFPLLIYNGNQKWTSKVKLQDIIKDGLPSKFIPNFEYYPIIINQIDTKILLSIHNAVSVIFFSESSNTAEFTSAISRLIELLKDCTQVESEVLNYWFRSFLVQGNDQQKNMEYNKIISAVEVLPMFAETLEQERKERYIKGKLEGKLEEKIMTAIKLYQEGVELQFISKVTELSLAQISSAIKNL